MKLRNGIFHLVSLALVTYAVASSNPQAPNAEPAEKRYKNIKVFKGVPADDIHPAMEMMSASLGVRCDFCHVHTEKGEWLMDKDDKPEKESARQMVLMMRKINEENFNGRMEVTCATCHQGHSHPVSFAPLGVARQQQSAGTPAAAPTAESLMDKYVTALGGAGAVEKLKTLHLKGTHESGGRSLELESWAKTPSYSLTVATTPQGTFSEGLAGDNAWQAGPDGKAVTLTGGDLEEARRNAVFASTFRLKDQFKGFRRVREDTLDGKRVFVVDAQPSSGQQRERLYFDADSGLLVRMWAGTPTILGSLQTTTDYSDYRDVAGVKVPFKVVETTYRGTSTTTYSTIEGNVDIPDQRFKRP